MRRANTMRNILLFVVIIFIPVIGHIIGTMYILADSLTMSEKALWILVIWFLPFVGPALYLLVGQRRNRILGSPST